MEQFFAALISGVMSYFASNQLQDKQHTQNIGDWQMQNRYNEQMYNEYNSPKARAEQLAEAGMSDAGIGSALSGFNGSGTSIVSSPMQPTNIGDMFSQMFGSINDTMRLGNESAKNRADIEQIGIENGIKGKELDYWMVAFDDICKKPFYENEKLAAETYLKYEEAFTENIKSQTADLELKIKNEGKEDLIKQIHQQVEINASQIGLNSAEAKQAETNCLWLAAKVEEINDLKDVRQKEAAEAKFYKELLEKLGIPYQTLKDAADLGTKIFDSITDIFGLKFLKITKN